MPSFPMVLFIINNNNYDLGCPHYNINANTSNCGSVESFRRYLCSEVEQG